MKQRFAKLQVITTMLMIVKIFIIITVIIIIINISDTFLP